MKVLYKTTGQDIQDYADINLFSKIDINAQWWRDSSQAQVDGNHWPTAVWMQRLAILLSLDS